LLQAHITSGNISDKKGLQSLVRRKSLKSVKKIWADAGYQGSALKSYSEKYGKHLEVVKRPQARVRIYNDDWKAEWIPIERSFQVLPRRWVVERTFAWIGRYRRMSKDYEYLPKTAAFMIYLCMTKTMLSRYLSIS
jgi:transposase